MTAGSDFRTAFMREYKEPGLLYGELLSQVCQALDMIERLEADVRDNGLSVLGSKQQPVVNGSVAELRQQRAALARLLKDLDLAPRHNASEAARALSAARWQNAGAGAA